jgi:hypothetical protein
MNQYFPAENHPGIFSTQEWINSWRIAWEDSEAITIAVNDPSGVSSRCLFYSYRQKKFVSYSICTLFPAGISTPATPSLRSEYFILPDLSANDFISTALKLDSKWDQLFIPDIMLDSQQHRELLAAAEINGLTVLARDYATSYGVQIADNTFENYLKHISSNTRLKLFNKRKKFYARGDVRKLNIWPDVDGFIKILNEFHQQRWQKPCYQGRNMKQIKHFLKGISKAGGQPDLSVIYCNDKPVSAVLDVYYKKRIYNIQSGFIEKFQDGISLGTLHLGMQIENAFSTDAIFYDFMAGTGKNSNYKKNLATNSAGLVSVVLVRRGLLKALYMLNDGVKSIKSRLFK